MKVVKVRAYIEWDMEIDEDFVDDVEEFGVELTKAEIDYDLKYGRISKEDFDYEVVGVSEG